MRQNLEQLTGIRCYKAIVTNGVMSEEYCKYLSQKMDFIYFSFDRPKKLFLQQRKPKGSIEVYDAILQNANLVYNAGTYPSFKITVSRLTIDYLKEVDALQSNFYLEMLTCLEKQIIVRII